ncbi:glycosyltransferase family 39 protein [Alicyclobacillus cycloheptanicus]|uniref:4-amino-4-deoxy-L-arabinose transferase-like glycosyltransferase n=1 Tax=Alicyclobacillus cycloheptanicus TaxID=1457 RepID=A0ABT9XIR8_9BACL|nr:glycosyltransferase family 39 protein [Alicyclobacillus cycloheptanicus]MDQ0190097.1 4-amino-4-deoxy-L-arabinose transferase-like glycosyltransferase [Alicyclobacillus cycloheptanicus]WDM02071.1 glycosyltransferase family 39 protein [Alicyclobacillus cycloheptanicus]
MPKKKSSKTTGGSWKTGASWDGLLAAALAVVGLAYLYHSFPGPAAYQLYGDSVHYDLSARVLLTKHFYTYWGHGPDAQVTPGYPLFLAVCYWIGGHLSNHPHAGMHLAFLAQWVLAALTASVLYFISRRVLNRFWAVLVGLLWIVYPTTHGAYGQLLTEALFVPLLCAFVWLFLISLERKTAGWWFLSGLILGLAALVRPTVMPLVLAGLAACFLQFSRAGLHGQGGTAAKGITGFFAHLIGFLIPMVPWWIRNWVVFHRLLLTDTDVGNPLLFGSDPHFAVDTNLGRGLSSTQQEHLAITRALHGFSTHPLSELKWYTLDKLGLLFGQPWLGRDALFLHLQPALVIVGALGLLLLLRKPGLRVVSWLVIYLLVTQLPFLPIPRYAFPMMPFFFIGLFALLQFLAGALQSGKPRKAGRRSEAGTA